MRVFGERLIGLYTKIEDKNGNYIKYGSEDPKQNKEENVGAFRYYDVLQIFKDIVTNSHNFISTSSATMNSTYYNVTNSQRHGYSEETDEEYWNKLHSILVTDYNLNATEIRWIMMFIRDTLITASTPSYPAYSKFILENVDNLNAGVSNNNVTTVPLGATRYYYLYSTKSDQSRQVDFGVYLRVNADLYLTKSLYKTTLLINGKQQEYMYNTKNSYVDQDDNWIVDLNTGTYALQNTSPASSAQLRSNDADYNGTNIDIRSLRKSEYLYDDNESGYKNLQVFVTYKIAVKNASAVICSSVSEIVDYYDTDQYNYDPNSTIIQNNTFIGDTKGRKISDITVSTESIYKWKYNNNMSDYYKSSSNINGINNYGSLYITNIKDKSGNTIFETGSYTYIYLTLKVNKDSMTNRVKIDQDINKLLDNIASNDNDTTLGKKNIAEINGYKTYYYDNASQQYIKAGVIDVDSNPGSLRKGDLDSNGNIISSNRAWENRLEDDCDKAGNLKLVIDTDSNDTRKLSGYTFEDARTEISDNAVIGNGKFDLTDRDVQGNTDKKINGVTVELVELVQNVNSQGLFNGTYAGEKVWSSITYDNNWNISSNNNDRYASGTDRAKVILSGQGVFAVNPTQLEKEQGEYMFESIPPGDFFIRFLYGDDYDTILNNTNNDVNALIGDKGLNSIAYTGQDYKSTTYQQGIDQNSESVYNGIRQYVSVETQNYYNNINDIQTYRNIVSNTTPNPTYNVPPTASMYYYDIAKSDKVKNVSSAKDVYGYREREINYSKGSTNNSSVAGLQSLKNHRAEVLASSTQLTLKAKDEKEKGNVGNAKIDQINAIEELGTNTYMVAQTGVINTEVEYNRKSTDYGGSLSYSVEGLNLGLTERPEAQLSLSKELSNVQIKLASGKMLFDTTQSVPNLYYGSHYNNENVYEKEKSTGYRLRVAIANEQAERNEELVTAYMDEGLMSGATIRLIYKITVNNIGEVDYQDKQFYYLGKTNNADINNVSITTAEKVIDYITNEMNFEANYQNDVGDWSITTVEALINDNVDGHLVNNVYKDNLNTFNVLVTTRKLHDPLIPQAIDSTTEHIASSKEIYLTLSTLLTNTINDKNLTYTNLAEILETTNTLGRRMKLSIVGNQRMPKQSTDKSEDGSTEWIKPEEIDADSGQKVQVLTPTGANKDYNRMIVIAIVSMLIIGISVYGINKKVNTQKNIPQKP